MKCRQCGTDIADKALICFRCGTATTEAKFQAAPIRPRRRVSWALVATILMALLVLLAFLLINSGVLVTSGVRPLSDPRLTPLLTQLNQAFSADYDRKTTGFVPVWCGCGSEGTPPLVWGSDRGQTGV